MKSSLQLASGNFSKTSLVKPLKPVWYSDNFSPKKKFSNPVKNLFAINLYNGIPPFNAEFPSIRDAITASYCSNAIIDTIAGISLGVY